MVLKIMKGWSFDYAHLSDKYYTTANVDAKSFRNGSLCYFTEVYWVQLWARQGKSIIGCHEGSSMSVLREHDAIDHLLCAIGSFTSSPRSFAEIEKKDAWSGRIIIGLWVNFRLHSLYFKNIRRKLEWAWLEQQSIIHHVYMQNICKICVFPSIDGSAWIVQWFAVWLYHKRLFIHGIIIIFYCPIVAWTRGLAFKSPWYNQCHGVEERWNDLVLDSIMDCWFLSQFIDSIASCIWSHWVA